MTDRAEEIFEARARALALRREDSARTVLAHVLEFRAGGQLFALPVTALAEVLPMRPIAQLSQLPPWLAGLTQLRGELVAVLDLAQWFQVPGASAPRALILLEVEGRQLAVFADEVVGLRDLFTDELADGLGAETNSGRPVLAVTRTLDLVLDPPALFAHRDVSMNEEG